jgi:hypothetical protein
MAWHYFLLLKPDGKEKSKESQISNKQKFQNSNGVPVHNQIFFTTFQIMPNLNQNF